MQNTPNFNVEGQTAAFPNANALTVGSAFLYVNEVFVVKGFTAEHILAAGENGKSQKFYDFDFENWVRMGFITIK